MPVRQAAARGPSPSFPLGLGANGELSLIRNGDLGAEQLRLHTSLTSQHREIAHPSTSCTKLRVLHSGCLLDMAVISPTGCMRHMPALNRSRLQSLQACQMNSLPCALPIYVTILLLSAMNLTAVSPVFEGGHHSATARSILSQCFSCHYPYYYSHWSHQ